MRCSPKLANQLDDSVSHNTFCGEDRSYLKTVADEAVTVINAKNEKSD